MSKTGYFILGILNIVLISSCYKELVMYPEPSEGEFNFIITPEQEELILSSRSQNHLIKDPNPILYYNNKEYLTDRFQLRGATSLRFRRKSFSVNLDGRLSYFISGENRERNFEKFKLISLVFDYTYIEEGIAVEILKRLDLWPLFSFYTEVKLNNNTQGLYLFIEDPKEYFLYEENSPIILRRDYHNYVINHEVNEFASSQNYDYYNSRFNNIYNLITDYSGRQLYDSLVYYIDFEEYCKKIAVDMLLKNGDYTDEVYFYIKERNGGEVFGVVPWDYDDIFSELPHEVGRTWGPGTKFGNRFYNSMDDIYADVGHVLLFSVEDDLDYKIATDSFLYRIYLSELEKLLNTIDASVINTVFQEVRTKLIPFYDKPEIIEQSKYDETETTFELFEKNLIEKEKLLLDRRAWIIQELIQLDY